MPLEARKVSGRPFMLAVGRIDVGHAGRLGSGTRADHRGRKPRVGLSWCDRARIEHGRRCLVGEQLGRTLQPFKEAGVDRAKREGGAAHPIGQGRAIEIDALAGINLRLAIKRQVIGIFGDDDMGDERASVGMPFSISRSGAGAWLTSPSQARQAYFGRCRTSTLNCAGITVSGAFTPHS